MILPKDEEIQRCTLAQGHTANRKARPGLVHTSTGGLPFGFTPELSRGVLKIPMPTSYPNQLSSASAGVTWTLISF